MGALRSQLIRPTTKTLDLGPLDAAVCDACVPEGAELVLGATALARASFVDDIARDEIMVATMLLESWTPFKKSYTSASAINATRVGSISPGLGAR